MSKKAMETFQEVVLKLAETGPNTPNSSETKRLFEKLDKCDDYESEMEMVEKLLLSAEVDWGNEVEEYHNQLQSSDHDIVIEDVAVSLEQLEELPMEDLFHLTTNIDTLNPVAKDIKFSEPSLKTEHQPELMLRAKTEDESSRLHHEAPPASKRRRGRPRKQKSSRQDSEQKEKPQKRPRGRPPLYKKKMKSIDVHSLIY